MKRGLPGQLCLVLAVLIGAGCGDDDNVSSEVEARLAYMNLDRAVGLAMDLGFAGYAAASSANIPAQNGAGEVKGTITVSGKVDQGASNNKEMSLDLELVDYTDDPVADQTLAAVTYNTGATKPTLDLSLKKIPDGTLTGSLAGAFTMSGGLTGDVVLALTMSGALEADPADATKTRRKAGTTQITGTATSPYGTFQVDLTR